ncbi:MAG: prepilin-type N-terminal cleavage/methylation domain-containing protein [Gemmataceae bacterium]|nr:prepilin-type N-terminal cleavage/methylation domain-containing protein [Gemmataceae bacterium]
MLRPVMLSPSRRLVQPAARRAGFTLIEVLVVVAILVILATIAAVYVPKQLTEATKGTAVTGAVTIDRAINSYMTSVSNPGTSDEERLPTDPMQLVNPGWSTSFLPDGRQSLLDPWGKQYQFQQAQKEDGSVYIIVYTHAPDGTPISQHGAGAKSRVQ